MKDYRVRIRFRSRSITPLHSDTIFGQLCWVYRYSKGEQALLRDVLEGYDEQPAFMVSDGFPADCLPLPRVPAVTEEEEIHLCREFRGSSARDQYLLFLRKMKAVRKKEWIGCEGMTKLAMGLTPLKLARAMLAGVPDTSGAAEDKEELIPHNTINRLSRTVERGGGGFFHSRERLVQSRAFDVYIRTFVDWDVKFVTFLFSRLGEWGYGADRSTGRGQFAVESASECILPTEGNAVMALSRFIPDSSLQEGWYTIETKYGKLGGPFSMGGAAYPKTPLLLLKPGAVFRVQGTRPFYGQSVGAVHPGIRTVRQQTYLYPFFISLREA